jgi:hypothetical protein
LTSSAESVFDRGKLPVWVVRIRSLLLFTLASSPVADLRYAGLRYAVETLAYKLAH